MKKSRVAGRDDPKSVPARVLPYCYAARREDQSGARMDTALRSCVSRPPLVLRPDPVMHVSLVRCGRDGASQPALASALARPRAGLSPRSWARCRVLRTRCALTTWVPNDRHLGVGYQEVDRGAGEDPRRRADLQQYRHSALVFTTRLKCLPTSDAAGGDAVFLPPM
jgi:hypothetical protein